MNGLKHIKRLATDRARWIAANLYGRRPLREWPAWSGDVMEIKIPGNVSFKSEPSALGGANINVILDLLESVRGKTGAIAECGVFRGATLVTIAVWLRENGLNNEVFGFDSYQGFDLTIDYDLKLGGNADGEKRVGGFSNTSAQLVRNKLEVLGLASRVELVPGFFRDSLKPYSDKRFAFVHLDCDIYESYKDCLAFFYPRLEAGGVLLFDEYNDPPWPGCNQAVDEFLAATGETIELITRDNYQKYFVRKNGPRAA
jgi:O-methyltransferase